MLALCVVVLIVAMLPGRRVYSDANNCVGNGLAELANTEAHGGSCTSSYTKIVRTEAAGGWLAIVAAVSVVFGGLLVRDRPGRASAIGWAMWTALISVLLLMHSTDFLDFFDHVELLWASHVLAFATGMMLVLVLVGVPVVVIATRERPTDSLPVATDSTGSR